MFTKVGSVSVFVSDQDRAKAFYTGVLGMELRSDDPLYPSATSRWLAVAPGGAATEIILYLPDENWEHYKQVVGKSQAITLEVADMTAVYEKLKAKGVTFVEEPAEELWGTYAIIQDSEGNRLVLVESQHPSTSSSDQPGLEEAPGNTESNFTLHMKRTFDVSRQHLFRAWTQPEALQQWFHPSEQLTTLAENELRAGGDYRIEMRHPDGTTHCVTGLYREIKAPDRLVFSWQWQGTDEEVTRVALTFHEVGANRTELELIHDEFLSKKERDSHEEGWSGTLEQLTAYLGKQTG